MTSKLKQALIDWYSREDPRVIAWREFCRLHPDSPLLQPVDNPRIKFTRYPISVDISLD